MSVKTIPFGKKSDGTSVEKYIIENKNGTKAGIITLGATLADMIVKDKDSNEKDVLLGFDNLSDYLTLWDYQGAVVGPCANRIGGASFEIDGKKYNLTANEKGITCLHSAGEFNNAVWKAEIINDKSVAFTYRSPDALNGFPGNTDAEVIYTLSDNDELIIDYKAVSDKKTPINLTNHAYFNLNGYDCGDILSHTLKLNCSHFTPVDKNSIPTGEIRDVKGTPFSFIEAKEIGRDINAKDEQLEFTGGYDHNFCIDEWNGSLRKAAKAVGDKSGIVLEVLTTLPGVQFYAGNFLKGDKGKNGAEMNYRSGFCLETQYYPDSVNRPEFPSCVFDAGEEYKSQTVFKFSVI